jgi:hypothetical protein
MYFLQPTGNSFLCFRAPIVRSGNIVVIRSKPGLTMIKAFIVFSDFNLGVRIMDLSPSESVLQTVSEAEPFGKSSGLEMSTSLFRQDYFPPVQWRAPPWWR